jgi:hypothetical protein
VHLKLGTWERFVRLASDLGYAFSELDPGPGCALGFGDDGRAHLIASNLDGPEDYVGAIAAMSAIGPSPLDSAFPLNPELKGRLESALTADPQAAGPRNQPVSRLTGIALLILAPIVFVWPLMFMIPMGAGTTSVEPPKTQQVTPAYDPFALLQKGISPFQAEDLEGAQWASNALHPGDRQRAVVLDEHREPARQDRLPRPMARHRGRGRRQRRAGAPCEKRRHQPRHRHPSRRFHAATVTRRSARAVTNADRCGDDRAQIFRLMSSPSRRTCAGRVNAFATASRLFS